MQACDTKTEACNGLVMGGQFPAAMDGGGACNPSKAADEAALIEFLPADFNDQTLEQQVESLRDAKDRWLSANYGAARAKACCSDNDTDCPDQHCPEVGDLWAHYTNDVGHFMINKAKLTIGGQVIDSLWGTFLFCWEELSGKSGRRLTEMVGRRYVRSSLLCDSSESRVLHIPLLYFTLNTEPLFPWRPSRTMVSRSIVDFAKLEELVVVSRSDIAVRNARTGLALDVS